MKRGNRFRPCDDTPSREASAKSRADRSARSASIPVATSARRRRVVDLVEGHAHGMSQSSYTTCRHPCRLTDTASPPISCRASNACSTSRREDPVDRRHVAAGGRRARLHRRGALPGARLDRVDAGVPVRLRAAAVRRDRRRAVPRPRPRAHAGADGAAPDPHGGARPRLQQRQHLRQPVAARARRAHRGERVGGALLRAGAQGQRRRAGASLDAPARRRLHPLVQRRAFALRRHDPLAARAGARPRPAASG